MVTLKTKEEARVAAIPQSVTTALTQKLKLVIPDRMTMGADRRQPGRRSNEIEREIKLTRPYYLGVNEVTNKQYLEFDPDHEPGILGRALLDRENRPAVNVSWEDAVKFCNWLSDRDGLPPAYEQVGGEWKLVEPVNIGYRLPTEAEWAWGRPLCRRRRTDPLSLGRQHAATQRLRELCGRVCGQYGPVSYPGI